MSNKVSNKMSLARLLNNIVRSRRTSGSNIRLTWKPQVESLEHRRLLAATDAKLLEFLEAQSEEHGPQAIIGGTQSERGSSEWVVSVQDRFGHFCGGTLVAEDVVVTAAHCVEGVFASNLTAIVGRVDLSRSDDGESVSVSQIIVHPDYNARSNDSDIAVLRLSDPVSAAPIGYLTPDTASLADPGTQATVLGWGTTREGGASVTSLREVTVPIVSNVTANRPISYGGDVTDRMLAAGLTQGGVDSCQGDSGGPLVVNDSQGEPRLAGVVSWGEGCGRPNKFGIYARTTSFADWLDGIVGVSSDGQIDFVQDRYAIGEPASFVLRDRNVVGDEVQVTVSSAAGDQETVTLESFSPGRFRGEITVTNEAVNESDGTLNVAGEEVITVSYIDADDGSGNSATSTATARVVEDDFGDSAEEATPLVATDGEASIAGEIEFSGDSDWFSLEVSAGQGYIISQELDSLDDSTLGIFAEDGVTVLGFDDDSGRGLASELTYFAPQDGTIHIEASGFAVNVGTYTLVVQETSTATDDHSNIVGSATDVVLDDFIFGNINTVGDTDWFAFEATAGRSYQLSVEHRSLPDSQLRLVDSDGRTELAFNDDQSFNSREAQLFFRAHETKRMSVEVSGFGNSTGTYDLIVREVPDDHGHLPAGATELGAVTSQVARTGEITPLDADWFAFTAEQDEFYRFETFLSTLPDSVLRIYDSEGQQILAQNDDFVRNSLASRIVWQAPADGQFFVEVSGFDQAFGDYRVTIEPLRTAPNDDIGNRAETATELQIGDVVSGNVDFQSDRDWLQFDTVAGHEYTFEADLRTLNDSVLELFDSDGVTLLAENDDIAFPDRSSQIVWTAERTGTSYIVVSAFDGFLGSYRLSSSEVAPEFPLGDLDLDGVTNEEDIDAFYAGLRDGEMDDELDFDDDGEVNSGDATTLVVDYLGTNFGDANLDRSIDFADFLALSRNFGQAGGWADGDFDGDGSIGFQDFLQLSRNFGENFGEG